jgi:tetratricopeptide (TPR) repeat protein
MRAVWQDATVAESHTQPAIADTLPLAPLVPALGPGDRVGRYTLLEPIGRGGMGTVYAAHDPRLDRRIAIKVLRVAADDAAVRRDLMREGQALAMLSHPNVVPVYDIGIAEARVWLAMAELRGGTLSRWLSTPRPWQEIVRMFAAIGRGLAAAHTVGLIHGDFKPPNVLLDDDGVPKVVDFGLARRKDLHGDGVQLPGAVPRHDESTRVGLVRGTPAFMAPEQLCGDPLDARTDQFAFCVALWRALYREHPFMPGDLSTEMPVATFVDRVHRAAFVKPVPREGIGAVPRRVERALVRGLAARPAGRWPTMNELVDRLVRGRSPPLRWAIGTAVAGAIGAAVWAAPASRDEAPCGGTDELDTLWNHERAKQIGSRLSAFDVPFAEDTASRVTAGLDEWAKDWRAAHASACAADQRPTLRCLDDTKAGFATTLAILERADREALTRAVAAVQSLPQLDACTDELVPDGGPSPEAAAISRELATLDALDAAGRLDSALVTATSAALSADALGDPVLMARAHMGVGAVLESLGRYDDAERELERARWIAVESGNDQLAVSAMASLLKVVGHDLARIDDAREIERHAEATLGRFTPGPRVLAALRNSQGLVRLAAGEPESAIERFADAIDLTAQTPDGETRQRSPLNNYANALAAAGRYAEARAALERASQLAERELGRDHPAQVAYATNLGFIASRQGQGEAARRHLERAVSLAESSLGEGHPGHIEASNNLAVYLYSMGDIPRAQELFERALRDARKTIGPEHPSLGKVIGNLGLCAAELGDDHAALARYDEALALEEAGLGPDHIDVAQTLNNRGSALRRLGRFTEARSSYERALAIRTQRLGERHPDTATTINNLGLLALAEGDAASALVKHEQAYAIWLAAHGEKHHRVAEVLADRAAASVALGDLEAARTLLERAEAVWVAVDEADPAHHAETRLALAELLVGDPVRARRLARLALDAFEAAATPRADDIARTQALLQRLSG